MPPAATAATTAAAPAMKRSLFVLSPRDLLRLKTTTRDIVASPFHRCFQDVQAVYTRPQQKNTLNYGLLFETLWVLDFNMREYTKSTNAAEKAKRLHSWWWWLSILAFWKPAPILTSIPFIVAVLTRTVGLPTAAADVVFCHSVTGEPVPLVDPLGSTESSCLKRSRVSPKESPKTTLKLLQEEGGWPFAQLKCTRSGNISRLTPRYPGMHLIVPASSRMNTLMVSSPPWLTYTAVRSAFADRRCLVTQLDIFRRWHVSGRPYDAWLREDTLSFCTEVTSLAQERMTLVFRQLTSSSSCSFAQNVWAKFLFIVVAIVAWLWFFACVRVR